jgi:flagellar basal body-associated protein FliL
MYHTPSKRRKRVQLTFIYMLMVLSIVSIVFVLILVVQGYRYNSYDGKVEQGGLVQFDSRPSGATVSVDDITLSARTASHSTPPGVTETFFCQVL